MVYCVQDSSCISTCWKPRHISVGDSKMKESCEVMSVNCRLKSLHASFLIVSDISWNLEIICFLCQNRHPGTHGGKLFSLRTHSCQICSQNVSVINGLRPPTSACLVTLQSFLRWQGDDFPVCCPTVWLQLNVTSFLSVSTRSTCGLPLSVCLPGFCSCRKV